MNDMPTVTLENSDGGEVIGYFNFACLPRIGEIVTVPFKGSPDGCRMFEIKDIFHRALDVEAAATSSTVSITLRGTEID